MGVALQLQNVSKRYGSDVLALRDVSFDVPADTFVSIVGPSGCGKSTLLRIVAGLIEASDGQVLLDGQAVSGPVAHAGMVFQKPVLLDWRSVLDNVLFSVQIAGKPVQEYRQYALELLALSGLSGFEKAFPYQLSGGMQQRVALCRALLTDPALLLMDEPFGALDVMTRERLGLELLRIWQARRQCTILFVTHSIAEAVLLSDTVIVMSARPGAVQHVIAVDLPRPRSVRTMDMPEFVRLSSAIRGIIDL